MSSDLKRSTHSAEAEGWRHKHFPNFPENHMAQLFEQAAIPETMDWSRCEASRSSSRRIERLSKETGVPPEVRDSLAQGLPPIRRRLSTAALRSRKWKKFAGLVSSNPSDIFYVGISAVGFLFRKFKQRAKQRTLHSA